MKKIIALGLVGLALAGCQTTGTYQQYSYNNAPSPDGNSITLADTKNNSWKTTISNDPFDGKTIISKVGGGKSSIIVRYKKSDDVGMDNGIDVYYINGDSYICSSSSDYFGMDILIDGKKYREAGSMSTDKEAIFLYNGRSGWSSKDWLTLLAKGNKITIRTHDSCGEQITNTFNIKGWPKELYELQNPTQAQVTANGVDEFIYVLEDNHKEWCSYAESLNFEGGTLAFNKFWMSKKNWSNRMTNYTAGERIKRGFALGALAERETGSAFGYEKWLFNYSEKMCKLV